MPDQIGESPVVADMADNHRRNCHAEAKPANRHPDCVIVGEPIGKCLKTANLAQSFCPKGDGCAKTWVGEAEFQADQHVWEEMAVYACRRQTRPNPGSRHAAIKAADEPNFRLTKGRDHISEITGANPNVAVREHDYVVPDVRQHIDKV